MLVNPISLDGELVPYADEVVTFSTSSVGLTASKLAECSIGILRLDTGTGQGRIRLVGLDASTVNGYIVEAGQTLVLSKYECQLLKGIRTGGADCKGWVTYYKDRTNLNR